jgi:hypothetical protein
MHWLNKISPFLAKRVKHNKMAKGVQLLIATMMLTACTPVMAQGMQAGSMQSMTPSSAIGPEQDSLLPPEVVPIDPAAVSQVQSRQSSSTANPTELRKQAFGQLYGDQTSITPAPSKPWRAGQTAPAPMTQSGSTPAAFMPAAQGAQASQFGAPNYQMASNQASDGKAYSAQSQTLTGAPQNQPQQINTHRGGFSNVFSATTVMGIGAIARPFMSGYMMAAPFARF